MSEIVVSERMKQILIVVPLLSSALAVFFDVGYFYALDVNLFTVFSLAEHINFALEALPLALGGIFFAAVGVVLTSRLLHAEDKSKERIRTAGRAPSWKDRWPLLVQPAVIGILALNTWLRPGLVNYVMLGSLISGAILLWIIPSGGSRLTFMTMGTGSLLFALSFALGYDIATGYAANAPYRHTIKIGLLELKAKVVRSGEKGLLFHDEASKQLLFLPWSDIKRVSYK